MTDLHINLRGLAYGYDTERNFESLIENICEWNPDHIVCGGDLSFKEPRMEDVMKVAEALDSTKIPYSVIKGNHDNTKHFDAVFHPSERNGEIYFEKRIGETRCLFLDSNQGSISDLQLEWLKERLNADSPPLIFMHYPPIKSGIAYMDKNHIFQSSIDFLKIMESSKSHIHLFCGHCHSERYLQTNRLSIHITPSSISQLDERSQSVKIYHEKIGFRIIEIDPLGNLTTFIKYLF